MRQKNIIKKWKEGNKKWKKEEKREVNLHTFFVTNNMCKGLFFLQIKEKLSAFWNELFGNFYFYPVLWNDRI